MMVIVIVYFWETEEMILTQSDEFPLLLVPRTTFYVAVANGDSMLLHASTTVTFNLCLLLFWTFANQVYPSFLQTLK